MFDLRFLQNLKQKLTTGNRGSIYLNALAERYLGRLDLADLNWIQTDLAEQFLEVLTSKSNFKFALTPKETYENPDEQRRLEEVFRRLSVLTIENNDHFSEQGVKTFGFGFPILLYRDQKDPTKIIKAPLFIWSLDIERNFQRANEWIIKRNEDFAVISNVVLTAYLHADAAIQLTPVYDYFLNDAILDKDEIASLVAQQLHQLHPNRPTTDHTFRARLDESIAPLLSRQQIDKHPLEEATVLWSGIFGLFKSQKESIINDLDYFIDNLSTVEQQLSHPSAPVINLEHPFTAVDTDPSQQHILHCLQEGKNLVIQGPPGTGKSQVLTGIVSNIIANQGTCLIVCEKKTALDVIHQNLVDIGLGELSVIVEDIYRDRASVVHSIRERAQQRHPPYKPRPSYLRLLEQYQTQIAQLQAFHQAQFQPLLEDKTWTTLVNDFLSANKRYDKSALENVLPVAPFQFNVEEYEAILSIIDEAKARLAPLQQLAHPHDALHTHFFTPTPHVQNLDAHQIEQAKLQIQRALLSGLRQNQQAQTLIRETQAIYLEQLEQHYKEVYQSKLQLVYKLYYSSSSALQERIEQVIALNQTAQQQLVDTIKDYNARLNTHFEQVHTAKIGAIDATATHIKQIIYQALNETLQTIKEAQQDIMACLYEYEQLLEEHLEAHYIQKMDLVDKMKATIKAGLNSSPYFFNKPKGIFRAIMRSVGNKYKQLEQDKQNVLKQYDSLKKLHSQYAYFDINFKLNTSQTDFTFEEILQFLEHYTEAADHWHRDQKIIIQEEVKRLSSRYSWKTIPYKKEAQEINQHLSDFRAKILRNQLIQLEFKYDNSRLRTRYDQLEGIYQQITNIKTTVDEFIRTNEQSWEVYDYPTPQTGEALKDTFIGLQNVHQKQAYFDFTFRKLGRPKLLEDYYVVLEHLTVYRQAVETWYPKRMDIIHEYRNNFHANNLYQPLAFEARVKVLNEQLDKFLADYNQQQLFKLPFQLKGILFADQLEALKTLEQQLQQWKLTYEQFILETNENYFAGQYPIEASKQSTVDIWKMLEELHHQYDYFDFKFDPYQQDRETMQQSFIQNIAYYKQWTEQWYNSTPTLMDNWVKGLSPTFVCPHVLMKQEMTTVHQTLSRFQEDFNQLHCLQATFEFPSLVLNEQLSALMQQQEQLLTLQNSFDQFEDYYRLRCFWFQLNPTQQAAYKGLATLEEEHWQAAFTSWYLHALLAHHAHQLPDQTSYNATQALLLEYETTLQKMLVNHSLRYWRSKQTIETDRFHQEKAPIKLHSLYNKRGHTGSKRTPLRRIIATDTPLFKSFFPILLVNPSVCSSILPLDANLFDAVIFDEASQLRLEDTFCALIRGQRKIISGDSQQMPPSDYFQSSSLIAQETDDEVDETQQLINESIDFLTHSESLLEFALAEGHYRESFLEVHYRSKHPYLIDFSNAAFYGNRLSPLPSREAYTPIEFFQVDGAYINYTNQQEAEQIIDYIIALAKPHRGKSCPSVGIATFNIHQRNLILELIQARAVERPSEGKQLQKLFINGLFVKNLENIQGDERDVLIISTTFGLREDQRFRQHFGPINRKRGYRLLNVIITRAKEKLCVFTSIPTSYYEGYRALILEKGNIGKGIFYAYLAYAKAVSNGDDMTRQAILELLKNNGRNQAIQQELYTVQEDAFKLHVFDYLQQHYPKQVVLDYQYAGFSIPLLIKDKTGQARLALYFDTYHLAPSQEAYKWDLFQEQHLHTFGFQCYRIWSKDWWKDRSKAQMSLLQYIASLD